jgi:hypothetical protein
LHGFDEVKSVTSGKSRVELQEEGINKVLEIDNPSTQTIFRW